VTECTAKWAGVRKAANALSADAKKAGIDIAAAGPE
jgi:hypothetical protein